MSLEQTLGAVAERLSLRRLAAALEVAPTLRHHKARDAAAITALGEALKGQIPTLNDFERDFS